MGKSQQKTQLLQLYVQKAEKKKTTEKHKKEHNEIKEKGIRNVFQYTNQDIIYSSCTAYGRHMY